MASTCDGGVAGQCSGPQRLFADPSVRTHRGGDRGARPADVARRLIAFADVAVAHWKKIWSTNPPGAGEQGDRTSHRRGRRLPQPRGRALLPAWCSSRVTTNGK